MHVVLVLQYWYPYEGALQPIYSRIVDGMVDAGHRVTIITSRPHYRRGSTPVGDDAPGGKWLWDRESDGALAIVRTAVLAPAYSRRRWALPARAVSYASFSILAFLAALATVRSGDVVFAASSPPVVGPAIACLAARLKGGRFAYNAQDVYPQIATASGLMRDGLLVRVIRRLQSLLYRSADALITVSGQMRDFLVEQGADPERTHVIHNFADPEVIRPAPKRGPLVNEHGLGDKFVLMFAGNMGMVQSLDMVLNAASRLVDLPNLCVVFVGRGERRDDIERWAKSSGVDNVIVEAPRPYAEMTAVYAAADVCLLTLAPGLTRYASPSKLFSILASGKPVLGAVDPDSDVARLIREHGVGTVVAPGSSEALAAAIREYVDDPGRARTEGERARELATGELAPDRAVARYLEVLSAL